MIESTLQTTQYGEILKYMKDDSSYIIGCQNRGYIVVFGGTLHGVYPTEETAIATINAVMATTKKVRPYSC